MSLTFWVERTDKKQARALVKLLRDADQVFGRPRSMHARRSLLSAMHHARPMAASALFVRLRSSVPPLRFT